MVEKNGSLTGGNGNQDWETKTTPKFVYTIYFGNLPQAIVGLPGLGYTNSMDYTRIIENLYRDGNNGYCNQILACYLRRTISLPLLVFSYLFLVELN